MALSDKLNVPPSPDARRPRQSHPKGFEPGVTYVAGQPDEIALQFVRVPEEAKWREEITRITQIAIPDHREVVLEGVRYWGNPGDLNVYCRFKITDREQLLPDVDAAALLAELRTTSTHTDPLTYAGESTLVVSWNDWQTGKLQGGGTPALAERLDRAFSGVITRAHELRAIGRDLGHLVILGGGDMIEGCAIFPNQAYEIDTDRRGQIRNTVTFILEGLDRLAPLFERVTVLVVGGNHGENRQQGQRVNRHDNDDCAVFEHAALAAGRDERLGHVNFVIAQDEPAKTLEVNGWILGTTHGHAFGRTAGGAEAKAYRWFSGQAAGKHAVGDADVLVTHHFHHYALRDWGGCQWVQTPAMDGGSAFFTDYSGQHAASGMLTFVMSPDSRFADAQIVGGP